MSIDWKSLNEILDEILYQLEKEKEKREKAISEKSIYKPR